MYSPVYLQYIFAKHVEIAEFIATHAKVYVQFSKIV